MPNLMRVTLVGCDVDDEALDELREHAQVIISNKWVYA